MTGAKREAKELRVFISSSAETPRWAAGVMKEPDYLLSESASNDTDAVAPIDMPFYLYDAYARTTKQALPELSATEVGGAVPNNGRDDQLLALHEAVERLSLLPEDSEFYIDLGTKRSATRFLNLIADRDVDLPKLFPHDGEALVFTWLLGPVKRYITVAGDEVTGQDISRTSFVRCKYDLPIDPPGRRSEWLDRVGTGPVATSVSTDDAV